LLTTDFERRIPFTAVDHTGSKTTVVLGLQQMWSDAVEQEAILIFAHILYMKLEYFPTGSPGEDLNAATESAIIMFYLA